MGNEKNNQESGPFQFALALFDSKPEILKKPVQAIHMAVTGGIQNKTQRLAWNAMLKEAHNWEKEHPNQHSDIYSIPRAKLTKMIGYTSPNVKHLKEVLEQMMNMKVKWDLLQKDGESVWGACVLMPFVSFDKDKIYYSYFPQIKQYLFNSDTWSRLDLAIQRRFRLDTSAALYEWVNRYRNNPSKRTTEMSWQDWRWAIYGPVHEGAILNQYKEFKRDKLKPAIEEINAVSDLKITLLEKKDGQKRVTTLQFIVEENGVFELPEEDPKVIKEWDGKLKALGLLARDRRKILSTYKLDAIEAHYEYTLMRGNDSSQDKLKSAAAYFRHAIKNGYANGAPKEAKKPAVDPNALTEIQDEFNASRTKDAAAMFAEMALDQQEANIQEYNSQQELQDIQIPETPSKRTKRFMAPFYSWLAKKTWGEPSMQELLEYAVKAGKIAFTSR